MANTIFSEEEIQQFRAETKGAAHKIHFNNAGSALPPDVVVDTVINYLQEEAMNGGYETEFKYKDELENTYNLIARLVNANPDEIAILENASTAWSAAFYAINFKPGDEIITSEMEYVTNLIAFANAEKKSGISVKVIPNDEQGNFPLAELEKAVTPKTKLIAVTQIPSTAGGMVPIVEIGKIARKHNILYLVDACQSAGQLPLDVAEIGCDMFSVTGRKYLRAPRGTGFLYVRKEIQSQLNPIFMDGFTAELVGQHEFKIRNDARRFELYENNRALVLGLGKAVEYALNIGIDKIWQRIQFLANKLRQQLKAIDGITIHDFGDEQCGIITFSVKGIDSTEVKTKLFEKNINVSVGKASSTLIYMDKNQLSSIVRASVHYYNTEEEVGVLCRELKEMMQ
ncbi:aminotransferase class V-fold PLP-dependent enzyme [Mucilaginibacter jinjuensis]|uniref:Aminotransferase class V-fold PLP-dependent enzyme n=1 Tax=Mucilaginibacter jinjuensis TaxID=1176721 RepID=A0ABY7T651_9SPHI|nr:aminotransferase class V-fold PLP-dependent enzyme [Mucilaginibacter jinjuensis]WCT11960.1 aminotransferase class V-fold PLP-dependent enzyme [Mucilaginibacter jinjuensis]